MGWFSSPKPDPGMAAAAARQAATAERSQAIAEEEIKLARERDARYDPVYQRLLAQQEAEGQRNAEFSAEEMNRYRTVARPLQDRMVADANEWDSADGMARATGQAAATVQGQWDAARDSNARAMAANGVSPDSGRGIQGGIDDANNLALSKAGAINSETTNRKMQGMQLRSGALGQMTGTAGTSLQASQLAVGANNAAGGVPGTQASARGANMQPGLAYANQGLAANSSAASILGAEYQGRVQAQGSKMGMIGSVLGMGARFLPIPGREKGGPITKGQPYVVGEAGPEIVVPEEDGTVVPNHALPKMPTAGAPMAPAAGGVDMAAISALEMRLAKLERAASHPLRQAGDPRVAGLASLRI